MSVREKDDPELYAKIQEQNLLRQYDLLSNCIEIGLRKGIEFFDKYTLWALELRGRLEPFPVWRTLPRRADLFAESLPTSL